MSTTTINVVVKDGGTKVFNNISKAAMKMDSGISGASGASEQFNKTTKKNMVSMKKYNTMLSTTAREFLGLTTAYMTFIKIAQTLGDISDTARYFENQLISIRKTANLTVEELAKLKEEIFDLGDSMRGIKTEELLEFGIIAGQAGIKGTKNIALFSKEISMLVVANEDLATNLDVNTRLFVDMANVLQVPIEELDRLSSVVTELSNNTTANATDLINFSKFLQSSAVSAGLTSEQVLALSASLKEAGQRAESSGSALSRIFVGMSTEAEKFAAVTKTSLSDFQTLVEQKPLKALTLLLRSLKDLANVDRNKALKFLGLNAIETNKVLKGLIATMDKYDKNLRIASVAQEKGTATLNEYNIQAEKFQAQMIQQENRINRVADLFGNKLNPSILEAKKIQADFLTALDPEEILKYAKVLGILGAGFIATRKVINPLSTSIKTLHAQFVNNTIIVDKFGVAMTRAQKRTDALNRGFKKITGTLKGNWLGILLTGLATASVAFSDTKDDIDDMIDSMLKAESKSKVLSKAMVDFRKQEEKLKLEALKEKRKELEKDKEGVALRHITTKGIREEEIVIRAKIEAIDKLIKKQEELINAQEKTPTISGAKKTVGRGTGTFVEPVSLIELERWAIEYTTIVEGALRGELVALSIEFSHQEEIIKDRIQLQEWFEAKRASIIEKHRKKRGKDRSFDFKELKQLTVAVPDTFQARVIENINDGSITLAMGEALIAGAEAFDSILKAGVEGALSSGINDALSGRFDFTNFGNQMKQVVMNAAAQGVAASALTGVGTGGLLAVAAGATALGGFLGGGGGAEGISRQEATNLLLDKLISSLDENTRVLSLQGLEGTALIEEMAGFSAEVTRLKEKVIPASLAALKALAVDPGMGEAGVREIITPFGVTLEDIKVGKTYIDTQQLLIDVQSDYNTAVLESSSAFENSGLSLASLADQLGLVEVQTDREATALKRLGVTTKAEFENLIKTAALAGNELADATTDWEDLLPAQQDALIAVTNFSEEVSILGEVFTEVGDGVVNLIDKLSTEFGSLKSALQGFEGIAQVTTAFADELITQTLAPEAALVELKARYTKELSEATVAGAALETDPFNLELIAKRRKEVDEAINVGRLLTDLSTNIETTSVAGIETRTDVADDMRTIATEATTRESLMISQIELQQDQITAIDSTTEEVALLRQDIADFLVAATLNGSAG